MADMTFNEYANAAMRTAGRLEAGEMLLNGAMGLCGEAGEVIDHIKKWRFQGHRLNTNKVIEELGDVLWYVACTAAGLGVSMSEIAQRNLDKLAKRYPKGHFDREDSIRRRDRM